MNLKSSKRYFLVYFLIANQRFMCGYIYGIWIPLYDHVITWMANLLIYKGRNSNSQKFSISVDNLQEIKDYPEYYVAVSYYSLAIALYCLVGGLGSLLIGNLNDIYGRKLLLTANAVLCIFSTSLLSLCRITNSIALFVISRSLTGLFYGLAATNANQYLIEITPLKHRTTAATVLQFVTSVGALLGTLLPLEYFYNVSNSWPYFNLVMSFYPLLQLVFHRIIPESPNYLFRHKRYDEVNQVICHLFQNEYSLKDYDFKEETIHDRIKRLGKISVPEGSDNIKSRNTTFGDYDDKLIRNMEKSVWFQIYTDPVLLRSILYSCVVVAAMGCSGMDMIYFNLTSIIQNNFDFNRKMSQAFTAGVNFIRMIFYLSGTLISRRFSRKTILLTSMAGVAVCNLLIFVLEKLDTHFAATKLTTESVPIYQNNTYVSVLQLIFIAMAYFFFDAGLGMIGFAIAVEVLEPSYKSIGQQITMTFYNVLISINMYLVTFLKEKLGEYLFLVFVVSND